MQVKLSWTGGMSFESRNDRGQAVKIDGDSAGAAQRPKELVLSGLAGCTAVDVLMILEKMRTPPKSLEVLVEAKQTEEHPRVFSEIHLTYLVSGDVPEKNVQRAIELSQQRYCGVSIMLGKTAKISYEYRLKDD